MKLPTTSTSAAMASQAMRESGQESGCITRALGAHRKTTYSTNGATNRTISVKTGRIMGLLHPSPEGGGWSTELTGWGRYQRNPTPPPAAAASLPPPKGEGGQRS